MIQLRLTLQDQKGVQSLLGVNYAGILIFQNNRKTSFYKWSEVQKINYEGKMFIVHLIHVEVCLYLLSFYQR